MRERKADIPLLAQAFVREFARENDKPVKESAPEAMQALLAVSHGLVTCASCAQPWNTQWCFAGESESGNATFPQAVRQGTDPDFAPHEEKRGSVAELSVKEAEKQLIMRALKECNGSRTDAARKLGMSRRTLHRKLHTYHLEGI